MGSEIRPIRKGDCEKKKRKGDCGEKRVSYKVAVNTKE